MQFSNDNNQKANKKGLLSVLVLMVALFVLCVLLGLRLESHTQQTLEVYVKKEEINADNFPFHYIDNHDTITKGNDVVNIDFDGYQEKEYLISEGGTYRLTGELNGSVNIKCKDEMVHLLLDNVTIKAQDGPALIIEDSLKTIITLMDNSKNSISDNGYYRTNSQYESCIYSESNLTINGTGSLDVYGLYKDGIRSKDVVKILDGTISIHSKKTGIHGTDGIHIAGGNVSVESEKNAFKTTKTALSNRGSIVLSGGNVSVVAGRYTYYTNARVYFGDCNITEKTISTFSNPGAQK